MRSLRFVPTIVLAAAFAILATPALGDCTADVRATPRTDQITDEAIIKVWAVEVDTQEDCATVYGDLIVTERLFDGEEITSTHRGSRKVSSHGTTYKINYRIAKDSTLTKWEFKVSRCVPCGAK
jgi:hypothetical protein